MFHCINLKGKKWFIARCAGAKKMRDIAWTRMKRNRNQRNKEDCKIARNEYVKIRRMEEIDYEKDIVEKYKDEPKLFYRFINDKTKMKEKVEKLRDGDKITEDERGMCELGNENFQQVFTKETKFNEPKHKTLEKQVGEIIVTQEDIYKMMEGLEVRKAMGPDGISGFILKECRKQLMEPVFDIINCSLKTGRVPKEWKRAKIVPVYKSGKTDEPLNYRPASMTSIVCKIYDC